MRIIVTGAGGFVAQALCQQLVEAGHTNLVLMDTQFHERHFADISSITYIQGDLRDASLRQQLFTEGCDVLFHLAAVPGGAAEANPQLSKDVNLDASIALIEMAAASGHCPRVVYTSSIAVLGAPMPAEVDDMSPIVPAMTYGAHKAMMELLLADMTRRGLINSVAVRLPGILARPAAPSGLKSAFMSNLFHSAKAGEGFVSPVSAEATMWLMSVTQCAANLMHAMHVDSKQMPELKVVTLPALRVTMAQLINTVYDYCNNQQPEIRYQPDPVLEANFGAQPPLRTPAAEKAGFQHDGDLTTLVARAFAHMR